MRTVAAELNVLLRNEKSVPCNLDALTNSLQVYEYTLRVVYTDIVRIFKATPTIVEEAFIFYLLTFFCHAPILPRDDVAALRQKYISG